MKSRITLLTILDWFMIAVFVFSVAVQYNDPDSLRWVVIYLAALIAALLFQARRLPWIYAVAVAVVALTWSVALAPGVYGKVAFFKMFEEFEMKDENVEVARESVGLAIAGVWMLVLAYRAFRQKQRATAAR